MIELGLLNYLGIRPLLIDKLNNDSISKSRMDSYGIATRRTEAITPLWLQPEAIEGYRVSRGHHEYLILKATAEVSPATR